MAFDEVFVEEAILRQANDQEFERYVTHARMKIRAPMRDERSGSAMAEKPAAPAMVPAPTPAVPAPAPASPPRSAPPPPPRGRSRADELLRESPLSAR
jgi:hypothetical protein